MEVWPPQLQKYFNESGFSYTAGEGALRTTMQVGLPDSRPLLSDVVWVAKGSINIPLREFQILTNFYEKTLKNGSLRFQKNDPVDDTVSWLWRFVKPFVVSGFGGTHLQVQLELERIPATDT